MEIDFLQTEYMEGDGDCPILYEERNGSMVPICYMARHPACSKRLFNKIIGKLGNPALVPPERIGYINPVPRMGETPVHQRPVPRQEVTVRNFNPLRDIDNQ